MKISSAIAAFLLSLAANNTTKANREFYQRKLNHFAAMFPDRDLESITRDDVREWRLSLDERTRWQGNANEGGELSDHTKDNYIRSLHTFFKWCKEEYKLKDDPSRAIKRIKLNRSSEGKIMAISDLQKMLNACETANLAGLRERTLLVFMADTGARASEVIGLTFQRLNLDQHRATLFGKGAKLRAVPLSPITVDYLRTWIADRPRSKKRTDTVFCSFNPIGGPLTVHGLEQILERIATRAGVTGPFNPHSLRWAFATNYLLENGDVGTLQQLMGHTHISTTQGYLAFTEKDLSEAHAQHTPLRRLEVEKPE